MIVFIADSLIPLGVAGGVLYILAVLIPLWSSNRHLPYYVAMVTSTLTIIGFYCSPTGGELWQVIFNRTLALFVIWITAFLSVQRITLMLEREGVFKEIRGLQGIIPICSYCNHIREDEGAWRKLESYVMEHTETEFSHGLCPDCDVRVRAESGLKKYRHIS